MNLEHLLLELGKEIGLGKLTLGKEGICRLRVNGSYLLSIEPALEHGHFFVYAVVAKVAEHAAEKLFKTALEGNLFGKETGEASLGYDTSTATVVLFQRFNLHHLHFDPFYRALQEFAQRLVHWSHRLSGESDMPPSSPPDKKIFFA